MCPFLRRHEKEKNLIEKIKDTIALLQIYFSYNVSSYHKEKSAEEENIP